MNKVIQQITSFILPVTVLIIVPLCIERDLSVKYTSTLVAGLFIMIMGLALMTVTIMSFIKIGRGTLAPWSPTKRLITTGILRICQESYDTWGIYGTDRRISYNSIARDINLGADLLHCQQCLVPHL